VRISGIRPFPTDFPALLGVAPAAYGSWWVTNGSEGGEPPRVRRLDPETFEVTEVIELGGETGVFPPDADGAAVSKNGVWVGLASQEAVVLVDPKTNKVARRIEVDATPYRMLEDGDNLWISDFGNSQVLRVDLKTGEEEFRVSIPSVTEMRIGPEGFWVVEHDGFVTRLDPETGEQLARVEVGGRPGVTLGLGSVWAGSDDEKTLSRIDPMSNEVIATIDLPSNGKDAVIADGSVWIAVSPQRGACEGASYLVRIDPASNAIDGLLGLPCVGIGVSEDGRVRVGTTVDGVMSIGYMETSP
jgi:streptogramin lyase